MLLRNRKGAHVIIEQVFLVIMGVAILVMVMNIFYGIRTSTTDFIAGEQLHSISVYTGSAAIQVYTNGQYADYGKIYLELPDRAGTYGYEVYFNSTSKHVVASARDADLSQSLKLNNITANLVGRISSGGGRPYVSYDAINDEIELGVE
jgi:hypothetical protein